ncbi:MAG: hypothetical protein K5798_00720 [Nitrosopumilus sp.]|uniref:Uncharacterized protein n=1 Tax=Nitrosopumilus zosterae TaxID=718286 RepID=A0A2S2KTD8_9ARCH|nr:MULTISPECIES: hypothetical protein [Nitrosopumilus]MCV0365773.1 hypothetical protein [Nitrosopumilus sp.]BDQ29984.1 hypothetical protein NZOSNM25_000075 [Nitrosopumilus zosterae]GBH34914.1 hypothetical protein NZNM25_17050 [Nitrosopumilus zosterae]
MALQSKTTVYAAVIGVLGLMGGIVYYASLDNVDLDQVEIELTNVELIDVSSINNQAKFEVTFLVKNPSDKTFTVSVIEYNLYGDETLLGSGIYSTADIALPGRALFSSGAEIPLKNTFVLSKDDVNTEIYEAIIDNKITSFSAEGSITTQSSWSEAQKEFKTGY